MSERDLQFEAIKKTYLVNVENLTDELMRAFLKKDSYQINFIGAAFIDLKIQLMDSLRSHAALKRVVL